MNEIKVDILNVIYQAKKDGLLLFLEDEELKIKVEQGKTIEENLIREIKENKVEIISFLKKTSDNVRTPITRESDLHEGRIPLSYSQERLWFIDALSGSSHYHVPVVMRINGVLDITILERSFQLLLERHQVLRTVIKEEDGIAYQEVKESAGFKLSYFDNINPGLISERISSVVAIPFDLGDDYMLRASVYGIGTDQYCMVLVMHHIASDGWSIPILFKELQYFYDCLASESVIVLPDLPIQYSDYSIWQRSDSEVSVLSSKLSFWQETLGGVPVLELPTDYIRPSVQSTKGSNYVFSLDSGLSALIRKLSQSEDCSLFMFLLASYTLLLHRYTGQYDISVGTPVANRPYQEIEGLIGFFVNTLVLRNQIDEGLDFLTFLGSVKRSTLLAYDHQEVPFEKLVSHLGLDRDQSRSPLFQTMLVLQNNDRVSDVRFGGASVNIESYDYLAAKEDLTLYVGDSGTEIGFSIEYCTDLFKESTIIRMADHFKNLIESIVASPTSKIGTFELLSTKEKYQLLKEFNNYKAVYPDQTILDIFTEQLQYYGNKEAVIDGEITITYRELNLTSSKLALFLYEKGVREGNMIPVCMNRSSGMIISIMAVLKLGAIYVPVDPYNPIDRIQFILNDIDADIVVSNSHYKDLYKNLDTITVLYLDDLDIDIEVYEDALIERVVTPDQIAYVIYTSGTTGNPKGVQVSHRALHTLLNSMSVNYPLNSMDRLLFKTMFTFDVSIYEIFGWILAGASLVIYPIDHDKNVNELIDITEKYGITQLQMVPSLFSVFIDTILDFDQIVLPNLTYIFLAGEALSPVLIEKYRKSGLSATLVNIYGPTENTVYTSHYVLDLSKNSDRNNIPIGKPLNNVVLYVVDDSIQLVPIGVLGELCIGGAQLAEGYLNRQELTNQKFIQNPFDQEGNSRLYRTGDVVRWLPNGTIEFVGRKDSQVKVRGYRIELGEIEVQLERLLYIKQAVVLVKQDALENKKLVGYIKLEGALDSSRIISELKGFLPEYMIPHIYVEIQEFPLTSSGKMDTKLLPDPDINTLSTKKYVAPQSNLEKELVTIWQGLLKIDQVGVYDNFFALGGDSIIAIQFVNRARKKGYNFRVRDVFTYQNIHELMVCVKNQIDAKADQAPLDGTIKLLPIQSSFFEKNFTHNDHYNQSVLLTVSKNYSRVIIEKALQILLKQHDSLRLRYVKNDNTFIGSYDTQQTVLNAENVAKQNNWKERITEICSSYQLSLSIENGNLAKFVWIQTPYSEKDNRLFITIHHLVVDGVSWRIILDDLSNYIYELQIGNTELPYFKTTSYRQWQQKLTAYANSSLLQLELPYWKSILAHKTSFPQDKEYDGITTFLETKNYVVDFDKEHTHMLLHECNQAVGTEINDLLLAALTISLCDWTKQSTIRIGFEGHGREELFDDIDISHTVGWFTTLFPISLTKSPEGLLSTIIGVKESLRGIPNKGIGYGVLRYLNENSITREELSENVEEVIFNYLGQFESDTHNNIFSFAREPKGNDISLANQNLSKIIVNGSIINDTLQFIWSYDVNRYENDTIRLVAENFRQILCEIIQVCKKTKIIIKTPNDYGLSGSASIKELNNFIQGHEDVRSIEDIYILSPLQEGILFHSLYENSANAYVVQMSLDLIGTFILEHFEKAWKILIKAHSVLRTGFFHDVFELAIQCLYYNVEVPIRILDFTNKDKEQQDKEVATILEKDAKEPFDLKKPPLLRLTLITLENNRTKMIFTNHHILFDGWSLPVILGEMLTIYTALNKGNRPNVIPQDTYKDYIRYLNNKSAYDIANYWEEYLREIEEPSLLPFVKSNTTNRVFGNTTIKLIKDNVFTERLETYAKSNHITVNTILQGVWAYLLFRYTNNPIIVFGTVISGRPSSIENIESKVGLYINTIPLCAKINNNENCISWLQSIQKGYAVSREEYGYYSLAEIQGQKKVAKDLFDSILVFENYPIDTVSKVQSDLAIENIQADEQTNYTLTISCHLSDNKIEVDFKYNSAILCDTIAERIQLHFDKVLQQIIEVPKLCDINYLPESEYHQLLSFNKTFFDYDRGCSLIDSFYDMVVLYSSKTALVFNEESMTYQELYDRSNQLAHCLKSKGANPGDRIGLLSYRGLDMLVSIFGILQTGCVYVPLHAEYPSQRLSYILEDAGVKQLVCTDMDLLSAKGISGLYDIVSFSDLSECPDTPIDVLLCHDSLAYLMYTSGSTGVPKGVKVTHGNIQKLVNDQGAIGVRSSDVVLQWSNYAFDGSVYEIFSCLLSGATLHLINKEEASSAIAVSKLLVERSISVCFLTTALFNALVDYDVSSLSGVRRVLFGGELVSPSHVSRALEVMVPGNLVHVYGPTETVVYATSHQIYAIEGDCVPIGSPLSNTQIYIVNDNFQLCGLGVSGEICIGGEGVSKGYLNKDDVTSSHFVKNPFGSGFLYCTGDLGRWLEDGSIDFIGRRDSQVKIRGYRIELGEVESALQSLPMVDRAIVISDSAPGGGKRLIGYVVGGSDFNKGLLDSQLVNMLPEYMIPSFIIVLDSFPLTPNGKIDRKSLPEPGRDQDRSLDIKQGAYTSIERQLIPIWKEVLKVDGIEPQDNFFDLGGHSILATRLITTIRGTLKIDLGLETVFQYSVLSEMAAYIENRQTSQLPQITEQNQVDAIPLSFSQERLWFIDRLSGSEAYHSPIVLKLEGELNKKIVLKSIKQILYRHEALRTVFIEKEGIGYQQFLDEANYEIHVHQKLEDNDKIIQEEVKKSIAKPFNLAIDFKLRTEIFPITMDQNILVFVFHHIASDGWSIPVFIKELEHIYQANIDNEKISLIELPIQYKDYSIWQRNYLSGKTLEKKMTYWRENLKGGSSLVLPTDYPRPSEQQTEGASHYLAINAEVTTLLKKYFTSKNSTLFIGLLAIFKTLLYRYSGQQDISVGTPVANRSQKEVGNLIGYFANTLVIRSFLDGKLSFEEYLENIRKITIQAYQYQDVPFEKIVNELVTERDKGKNPLFQVMFIMQNNEQVSGLKLGEIKITPFPIENTSATFDLTCSISEHQEGLLVMFEYATTLFTPKTISRISKHFMILIDEVLNNSKCRLDELMMITSSERDEIVNTFNHRKKEYPKETVVTLFKRQVALTPNNIAVNFGEQQLTYKELDIRSDQFANMLWQNNVEEKELIPICVERSLDMVTAVLGVLKIGAVYVPIDPSYPKERIQFILEDIDAKRIISQATIIDNFDEKNIVQHCIDDADVQEKLSCKKPISKEVYIATDQLAYIIYTSGTTGKPKGVMIEHLGVTNLICNQIALMSICAEDKILQFSSFAFDAFVSELFTAINSGGSLIMVCKDDIYSKKKLTKILLEKKVTIATLPPSYQAELLEDLGSLKVVLSAGEALNKEVAKKLKEKGVLVVNGYGPTENTIGIAMSINPITIDNKVTIGKPLYNVEVYILNESDQLCPVGVIGELCVSGVQVARGYLNREKLTKEKFIANPFDLGDRSRLYKTGDLARWMPDGRIEFIGRKDTQVKIRGYRVELGEIEYQLEQFTAIRQAVVLMKKSKNNTALLVAYIISDATINCMKVKNTLKQKLPDYMVPQLFVEISSFPLTINGKVDRKALPEPTTDGLIEKKYVSPHNEIEARIAEIWSQVLDIEKIGIQDNFFEMGGSSILAIKLVAKLQEYFEVEINDIFQYQTIQELVKNISYEKNYLKNKLASYITKLKVMELAEQVASKAIKKQRKENEAKIKKQKKEYLNTIKGLRKLNFKEKIAYKNIFLLGATGYLGIHILHELLYRKEAKITVLIRAENKKAAFEKLQTKFQFYFTNNLAKFEDRLQIYNGDITLPAFGLEVFEYNDLAKNSDCIINCAANVKHYGEAEEFMKVNTYPIKTIIDFSIVKKQKPIHHISTLSIAGYVDGDVEDKDITVVFTEQETNTNQHHINNYTKSKFEADYLLDTARVNGAIVNIYRVGNLSYHSKTGKFQENIENNAFYNQVRASLFLEAVIDSEVKFEISCIDKVAEGIVKLFDKKALLNRNFHLKNKHLLSNKDYVKALNRSNFKVAALEARPFLENVLEKYDKNTELINRFLLHLNIFDAEKEQRAVHLVCSEETEFLLKKVGFEWNQIKEKDVKLMLDYGRAINFWISQK
ncbi:amino acid adenylation domain-containing protein [Aquimarina sp. ERC-38]|uniref:non-ribosomal peptide synthetase n=1 Tax=Aquimarina sp. ERC-38 TaxID=2949996 RepID=UPI0022450578|nr:non-ribosomal peptide synthetase [Aquimarina sp. ERC-38]UZO79165.1 amino acid adenylation domain-containing protein [Aquimarina sp. ERC-38]